MKPILTFQEMLQDTTHIYAGSTWPAWCSTRTVLEESKKPQIDFPERSQAGNGADGNQGASGVAKLSNCVSFLNNYRYAVAICCKYSSCIYEILWDALRTFTCINYATGPPCASLYSRCRRRCMHGANVAAPSEGFERWDGLELILVVCSISCAGSDAGWWTRKFKDPALHDCEIGRYEAVAVDRMISYSCPPTINIDKNDSEENDNGNNSISNSISNKRKKNKCENKSSKNDIKMMHNKSRTAPRRTATQ